MGDILIYRSEDGRTKIDVMLEAENLWLSQKQLTELFGKAKGTISEHIKNIFADGELDENSVVRFFRTTATDGKQYEVAHYNLDMVLALGYRVRSQVGVRFRQWASDKLKEYIVKCFALDDDRLKNPGKGRDYFDELTKRLQDIRTRCRLSLAGSRRNNEYSVRIGRQFGIDILEIEVLLPAGADYGVASVLEVFTQLLHGRYLRYCLLLFRHLAQHMTAFVDA